MYTQILTKEQFTTLKELYDKVKKIVNNDLITEEAKYDFIFSESISDELYKIVPKFEYYDPDTSYEEDVDAFVNAFDNLINSSYIVE